ncbi:MAG TPA: lipoate--protein ligase [Fastidiosipila sp.]|nr:lipoate--protein ligase [Fastidiosipila sp.]
MIYIETGSTDVYHNFAVEYYLTAVRPREEMTFLFWRTTPTLMIGKYQNPYEEVDVNYARENDIALVRRMSGGGTIFTDLGGWQFSFIDPEGRDDIAFEKYTKPVLEALEALDLPVTFSGRNDLLLHGKKFSGNAQYKLNDRTVHHGSLLFATDFETMVRATTVRKEKIQSKSLQSVRERVTNISEHLPRPLTNEGFKAHMVRFLAGDKEARLDEADWAEIQAIADARFRPKASFFERTPKFSIEREHRYETGLVQVRVNVVRGYIADLSLGGDFFAEQDIEDLEQTLKGVLYEYQSIIEALNKRDEKSGIHGVSVPELAALIVAGNE